ncbi:hypothetical protein Emag_006661 [Eimeria magna]
MADRLQDFLSLTGRRPSAFPPVPPPLWECVRGELTPELQRTQQQQQQQQQRGSFRFFAGACSCHEELCRVQQQLGRRLGPSRDAAAGAAGAAAADQRLSAASAPYGEEAGGPPGSRSAAAVAAEVSRLLQSVRQQQQRARDLEGLAEDLNDFHALQLLRQQQQQQQQVGETDGRDTRAHRHAILRFLYSEMQEVTGELQRLEVAALKQQMECSRYFSAVAAGVGPGGSKEGALSGGPAPPMTVGAAATEAAAAAEAAMRQQQQQLLQAGGKGKKHVAAAAAVALEEASEPQEQQQQQQQDPDSLLLLEDERQLLTTLNVDSVDTVVTIQRKLQEIVQAMNVFAFKVAEQAEVCFEIGSLAEAALSNVHGAEKELSTALNRHSKFKGYLVYAFLAMGFIVLFLDFCKSSRPYLL